LHDALRVKEVWGERPVEIGSFSPSLPRVKICSGSITDFLIMAYAALERRFSRIAV
jgi:hypothetical protein